MSEAERSSLPADLQPFIERRVKGCGSFAVFCRFPKHEGPVATEHPDGCPKGELRGPHVVRAKVISLAAFEGPLTVD